MSIKIYNGGYLSAPLGKTLPILKELKTRCTKYASNILKDGACEIAIEMAVNKSVGDSRSRKHLTYDEDHIYPPTFREKDRVSGLMYAVIVAQDWARYNQMEDRLTRIRHDCWIDLSLLLFPNMTDQEHTYFIAFGSDKMVDFLWKQKDLVQEYSFWNNVDKPESITAEEWEQRESIWEELLSYPIFSDCGFTHEICSKDTINFYDIKQRDLDKYIRETAENRLRSFTIDYCVNEILMAMRNEGKDYTFSEVSAFMREYGEKYKNGELELEKQIVSALFLPKDAKQVISVLQNN